MKQKKSAWILTCLGILLLLSSVIPGNALTADCIHKNGSFSMQKVLVSVKTQMDPNGLHAFSMDDIRRLKEALSNGELSFTAQSGLINTYVSSGGSDVAVNITGVDPMYPFFNGLSLVDGSFITPKHEEEGVMVAVIDSTLALELFNAGKVTGSTVEIYGSIFRIIGVIDRDDSLTGYLTDDGFAEVYIPAAVMLELDKTARITDIQIRTEDSSTLDQNSSVISEALQQTGKNPSNYYISDYNLQWALLEQKPSIFVFVLGIISVAMLLVYCKNLFIRLYRLIRDGCKTCYLVDVCRNNLTEIGGPLLEMLVAISGIMLLLSAIRFSLYIPQRYVPDELINISYYQDLIKSLVQGGLQSRGYVEPYPQLVFNTINKLSNLLFFVSLFLGPLLLRSGVRELREVIRSQNRLIIAVGILFIISVSALTAVAFASGLPSLMDLKGILVIWTFMFLNMIQITKRKESEMI